MLKGFGGMQEDLSTPGKPQVFRPVRALLLFITMFQVVSGVCLPSLCYLARPYRPEPDDVGEAKAVPRLRRRRPAAQLGQEGLPFELVWGRLH